MYISTYLATLFLLFPLFLSALSTPPRARRPSLPQQQKPKRALKQATRSQIVARASRPISFQRRQGQARALPFPVSTCPDYTSTGNVPYARWDNLDYAAQGAYYLARVASRETCTRTCELDARCIVSTYNPANLDYYEVTNQGNYANGPLRATQKGTTCAGLASVSAQFPSATCCTEYRT